MYYEGHRHLLIEPLTLVAILSHILGLEGRSLLGEPIVEKRGVHKGLTRLSPVPELYNGQVVSNERFPADKGRAQAPSSRGVKWIYNVCLYAHQLAAMYRKHEVSLC